MKTDHKRLQHIRTLQTLQGIGPKCSEKLYDAGICTPGMLKKLGPEETFIRCVGAHGWRKGLWCSCFLYALEGAITDTQWNKIPEKRKQELKTFFHEFRESLGGT